MRALATTCTSCPKGKFASLAGASMCYTCSAGQFQPRAGGFGCHGYVTLSSRGAELQLCGAVTPPLTLRKARAPAPPPGTPRAAYENF